MKCSNMGVGTACALDEKSYDGSQLTDDIIELMCDSGPKGNCDKFSKVDRNGDGIVNSQELNNWWAKKHPSGLNESGVRELKSELPPEEIKVRLSDGERAELVSTTPAKAIGIVGGKFYGQKLFRDDPKFQNVRLAEVTGYSLATLSAETLAKYPLPPKPTPKQIQAWQKHTLADPESKKIDLAEVTYVAPVYTYRVRGSVKLKPFSEETKKALGSYHGLSSDTVKPNQTVSPRLQGFELRGLRCAKGKMHGNELEPSH